MDDEQEKIIGSVTLFEATIRESIGSERKVDKECKTEDERIESLKEIYAIELTDEEKNGVPSALRLA